MTKMTDRKATGNTRLRTLCFSLFISFCGVASVANAETLVKEFKGRDSKTTAEFEVEAPWVMDWRTRGDYPGEMGFEVNLIKSPVGEYVGKVAATKWVDNGVKLFNEGGRYRFQVDASLIEWTIKVQQLTREEAEQYTIKKNALSPD